MNGKEWAKAHKSETDNALYALATDATYSISGKSRIARKAREYIAAREAFENQLDKNGVFAS
jgi:hypothetical protein